ncbi:ER membrane protein complex subunit 5 [Diutina catenulata]
MLYLVGALLLLHGGYSAYEFYYIAASNTSVPMDITLEVAVGSMLLILGAIESIKNQPILALDGTKVAPQATFLQPISQQSAFAEKKQLGLHDWQQLESRKDFVDVVAKRRQYNEWADNKSAASPEEI